MANTGPLVEVRRELAIALRERDRHKREHDKVLAQWTRERISLREKLREAQKRERVMVKLLVQYLAGEVSDEEAHRKLERVA